MNAYLENWYMKADSLYCLLETAGFFVIYTYVCVEAFSIRLLKNYNR